MAELSLAASIVGLISLGIQISQGLNLYIDSASNAKPRVQAIATDVDLAIQVVTQLEITIGEPRNKALISDSAQQTAKRCVSQFSLVFEQIKQKLPTPGQSGIRSYQKLRWPFTESKVNLLRAELGNAKATLQLLMTVITFAAMKQRYANVASLEQREQLIRRLKREDAEAAAKVATLKRIQDEDRSLGPGSAYDRHSETIRAASSWESSVSDEISQSNSQLVGEDNWHTANDSGNGLGMDFTEALCSDYNVCLDHLRALEVSIRNALHDLRKLESLGTSDSFTEAKRGIVNDVNKHGHRMVLCLNKRIVKSIRSRRLKREHDGDEGQRISESSSKSPVSADDRNPEIDATHVHDHFMDAVEYQLEDPEVRDPCPRAGGDHSERPTGVRVDAETAVSKVTQVAETSVAAAKSKREREIHKSDNAFTLSRHHQRGEQATPNLNVEPERYRQEDIASETDFREAVGRVPKSWKQESWEGRHWDNPYLPPHAYHYRDGHQYDTAFNEPQYSNLHRSYLQGYETRIPANIYIHNNIPINQETTIAHRTDSRLPMATSMFSTPQSPQVPMMQPPIFMHQQVPMIAAPFTEDDHALRAQRLGEQFPHEPTPAMLHHRHHSVLPDRSTELSRLRWELEQQRRGAAAADARHRHDRDIAALNQRFELERGEVEITAARAERIREVEVNALGMKLDLDPTKQQEGGATALESRRRYRNGATAPGIKIADNYRTGHVSHGRTRSEEGRKETKNFPPSKDRNDDNSSDNTASDDIENLVRDWTNLYDEDSTIVRRAAAERDRSVGGATNIAPAPHTYRSVQDPCILENKGFFASIEARKPPDQMMTFARDIATQKSVTEAVSSQATTRSAD
ncbi:hypothetical protein D6D17_06304 [Aureobasidium pullulans]|nr:hypothetical protein D6D29_08981 [Aureobasidium pullulans]THX00972.1 hypothetical protein D6D17_06304 [Aureobasidium pullulans]